MKTRSGWSPTLILLLLVGCSSAGTSDGTATTGAPQIKIDTPLDGPLPSGFSVKRAFNSDITIGQLTVQNLGSESLTLLEVVPRRGRQRLDVLGVQVAGLDRKFAINQIYDKWPPTDPDLGRLQDVPGAVLEPGEDSRTRGYEILLGLRVASMGRSTLTAIEIKYRTAGGERREVVFDSTFAVCTDSPTNNDCPIELGEN